MSSALFSVDGVLNASDKQRTAAYGELQFHANQIGVFGAPVRPDPVEGQVASLSEVGILFSLMLNALETQAAAIAGLEERLAWQTAEIVELRRLVEHAPAPADAPF